MTVEEAAAYSSIGINKIREMLKIPNCPFVLYIGNKKLVKRREFENYIEGNIELQIKKEHMDDRAFCNKINLLY